MAAIDIKADNDATPQYILSSSFEKNIALIYFFWDEYKAVSGALIFVNEWIPDKRFTEQNFNCFFNGAVPE